MSINIEATKPKFSNRQVVEHVRTGNKYIITGIPRNDGCGPLCRFEGLWYPCYSYREVRNYAGVEEENPTTLHGPFHRTQEDFESHFKAI